MIFVRGCKRDVSARYRIINNTLDSHLRYTKRFLTTAPVLQQRGALLCGNACEPSSVKPSSFMYMEEDEITAANKGFYACLCPFFIILYPVGCEAFPTDFGWTTEGSSHNLKTDFFSSSQTEMQFSWIKTSRQKTQTTAFTITTFYFIRSRRVWRKKTTFKMAWSPRCSMFKLPFRWHLPADFHERENFLRFGRLETP